MKSTKNSTVVLVAYVPVPHAGYLKFFRAYAGGVLYVLGNEFIKEFQPLVRHLPGVQSEEVRWMVKALNIFDRVHILTPRNMDEVLESTVVVMPDEDVSHAMAEKYFAGVAITFDGSWRLRWDWGATQVKRRPEGERVISTKEFDRELMRTSFKFADKSPDWWRQIGALLVKDGEVLLAAFNEHVPCEQSAYCYGDPRSNFEPGQDIDVSSALHAEVGLIAEAANRGISTRGCDLYVTTFPCPPCAGPCSRTGIKRLYYVDGYALVAGAEALQSRGVEIIRVEM
ncbi:MAG: deaminase [Candidatus Paceibacterota bacterium]|jgi:dCMP deaminase